MPRFKWKRVDQDEPPLDTVLMTKIDDDKGCRNECKLVFHKTGMGNAMWFVPDLSTYVYYRPTHWAYPRR